MSIEFLPFDPSRCSLASLRIQPERASSQSPALRAGKRPPSSRRLAANRRNARKSTGPKTRAGKIRSSRNALKHALCADTAIPACEDMPTFNIFLAELEEELQPHSIMQRILFPQIANLIWRLRRLPEAQAHLFDEELHKTESAEQLSASQLLARRFSDEPSNGFVLLGRYERAMQNTLLRLLNKYDYLKKHHPTTPYAPDEPAVPSVGSRSAAPTDAEMKVQIETFARREKEIPLHIPPRNLYERDVDTAIWRMAEQKRTQSNPTQNRDFSPKSEKCLDLARAADYETNPIHATVGGEHET